MHLLGRREIKRSGESREVASLEVWLRMEFLLAEVNGDSGIQPAAELRFLKGSGMEHGAKGGFGEL